MSTNIIEKLIKGILTILILAFFTGPLFYFMIISLKPEQDIWKLATLNFTFDNYVNILFRGVGQNSPTEILYQPLINSLIITCTSTLITIIVSLLASYSIARFNYRGRESIAFFMLTLYMVPPIINLVPLWSMAQSLNLLDSHFFLILIYTYFGIPFTVWLLRSFFEGVPRALEEAAMVDGDSRLGAFFHITLPLLKPAIAAATILRFMFNWNEFLFASTLTATKAKTMPVAIAQFGAWLMIDWGTMSALGIIAIAPIILLSLFVQKYIISGLTLGAVRE